MAFSRVKNAARASRRFRTSTNGKGGKIKNTSRGHAPPRMK